LLKTINVQGILGNCEYVSKGGSATKFLIIAKPASLLIGIDLRQGFGGGLEDYDVKLF
jgi:hypothetical protein